MQEIELKILNIVPALMEAKLLALGAHKVGTKQLEDKSFDTINNDIKRKNEVLRLRIIDGQGTLTFKANRRANEVRIADEHEVQVSDPVIMEQILLGLGYHLSKHRHKQRTSYKLDDVKFEIDEYPGIPPYLEIEGSEEAIKQAVIDLGYTLADATTMTATQVLKHYGEAKE